MFSMTENSYHPPKPLTPHYTHIRHIFTDAHLDSYPLSLRPQMEHHVLRVARARVASARGTWHGAAHLAHAHGTGMIES